MAMETLPVAVIGAGPVGQRLRIARWLSLAYVVRKRSETSPMPARPRSRRNVVTRYDASCPLCGGPMWK
jgi:hypothetical protein